MAMKFTPPPHPEPTKKSPHPFAEYKNCIYLWRFFIVVLNNSIHLILTKNSKKMKKVSLLIAMIAFVCGNAFAQLSFDFNDCPAGAKIAQTLGDPWTTWGNAPGGAEDGVFAEMGGSMAAHFTYGNDQVLKFGGATSGNWTFSFDMYIPNGKDAYNNVLHIFNGSASQWATEVYYKHSSTGTMIKAGGVETNFECPFDAWFNVKYNIDLDNDQATFSINNEVIYTWQFSLQADGTAGSRQLDAADFFPPTSAAVSEYYVDNILVEKVGGTATPHLTINPNNVTVSLEEDDMTSVEVKIENSGNSIGDWSGYLEFGQGVSGSGTAELYYHNGAEGNNIGSNTNEFVREMAIRLPANAYAGTAMGMKITSAKFLVGTSNKSADDHYTFRVYGQGMNGQPGEILAEKTITSTALGTWIEATFDEEVYMTGQIMWIGVELLQAAGEFPLTMDGGNYGEMQDGNWLSTSGGNFSHCYSAGNFEGAWMITANCQGTLVPGTWATINKTEGSIMGGANEIVTLTLNTIGLTEEHYAAKLIIDSNDPVSPHIEIPVSLQHVTGVEETVEQLASIYPNPANSMVTLNGENLNSVAIYNVAGQLIRVVKLNSVSNNIDMNVEAGVYFFSVYDNYGNNSVQRVVITK